MRLHILSDLHIEFDPFESSPARPDIVILAGDIGTKVRGVAWANQAFSCPVIYVCGNHEFYGGHIDRTLSKMRNAAAPHVRVLENETFVLEETRFLCTTAWTDYSSTGNTVAATRQCSEMMNDFRAIRIDANYRRLRPADLIIRNHHARMWLTAELCKPFDGKTVVVTHHCPTPHILGEKHDGHLSAAYANSWPELIEKADMWIYGHTHHAVDVDLAGCRMLSNPRGYPGERTGFVAGLEVDL